VNPTDYEHHVAAILRGEGWTATVTPPSSDGGIDVIAERPGRKLGVQAKMYGVGGRAVNQQAVHELFGAASAQGCTEFMIATDGDMSSDARASAEKLGVEVRNIAPVPSAAHASSPSSALDFGQVWDEVSRLQSTTLTRAGGSSNKILKVDGGGVLRRTSGGTTQRLEIEIFRWTIERLLAGKTVTRDAINHQYAKRGSSGVVLILASLPMFETTKVAGKLALRWTGATSD
jgi:hypothetical protein